MKLSTQIKPISYLKANSVEVIRRLSEDRMPLVITVNGEAKAVLQDMASYENTQATLARLKTLALGKQQIAEGRGVPLERAHKRKSVSRGTQRLARTEWPAAVRDLAGAWTDLPTATALRKTRGKNKVA